MAASPANIALDSNALAILREATLSRTPVSLGRRRTSSPHEFYRYPARFSPGFVRATIEAFSQPHDLVIDPFVGGGTTAIEALIACRRSLVADLNPLATFVTRVKTTPLQLRSQTVVRNWLNGLSEITLLNQTTPTIEGWAERGYLKDLETRLTWRITKVVRLALTAVDQSDKAASAFCRCIVLRTAQWALDMRSSIPTVHEFRAALIEHGEAMLDTTIEFTKSLPKPRYLPYVVDRGLPGLADEVGQLGLGPPALIVTSPPYPGVYVNYHRWKLLGRREIRAAYWITDQPDGNGLAHYTMHARADRTLDTYFSRLHSAFEDLARLAGPLTMVVQLVGFSDPLVQLPRYLRAMTMSGFGEMLIPDLATNDDGRLWRSVPGRRWWTEARSRKVIAPYTAQEVVLIHRLAPV